MGYGHRFKTTELQRFLVLSNKVSMLRTAVKEDVRYAITVGEAIVEKTGAEIRATTLDEWQDLLADRSFSVTDPEGVVVFDL